MQEHIVSSFDRDLEGIQARIMKMGGLVEQAILDAAEALETRDEELSDKVRRGDKVIDELDELIHEEAARVIALRAPTAVDLRVILSVMKTSNDLERIGDLAKNMAKRNSVLMQLTQIDGADIPEAGRNELYELRFDEGGRLDSQPHKRGTVEILSVISGTVEITSDEASARLACGDSARYAADLRHCIRAVDGDAKVFLVVQDSG